MTRRDPIEDVKEAFRFAFVAQSKLHKEIRRAHSEGASLRAIADASGMSHEKVRSLIRTDS